MDEKILQAQKEMEEKSFAKIQAKLSERIIIPPAREGFFPAKDSVFLGLDIQYVDNIAHVAADVWRWPGDHVETFAGMIEIHVPYVPSYFCFREGPALLAMVEHLRTQLQIIPDFFIVDGHGLAHPRKFGVACWLGLALQKPTLGCAKETLVHYDSLPEKLKGEKVPVTVDKETVGYVLVTQNNTRPIFVSPGHLVSLENAVEIVLSLPGQYRISEPMRQADHACREHAKRIHESIWTDLGQLALVDAWWDKEL